MRAFRAHYETGSGGFWVLPFLAVSWREVSGYRWTIWAGFLYWQFGVSFVRARVA